MNIAIFNSRKELAQSAASEASRIIRQAIDERGQANVIAATGASQFEFLEALVRQPNLDWAKTVFFHLDEYVGMAASHPASFRRYLQERIVDHVHPGAFHFVQGDSPDPSAECTRIGELISRHTIDVAFVGIGENGHLAFNDPPADFETVEAYLLVQLDEQCRRQQVGEGWFKTIHDVPTQAISMSVRQILKARNVICVAPEGRKARAVRDCVELEVNPLRPASILQQHPRTTLYLDSESSSLLRNG